MASFVLLQPLQFELQPLKVSPPASPRSGLFALRFLFDGSVNWQTRFPTYASPSAVNAFRRGAVVEAHLETLDYKGAAQKSLKGAPEFVVMGLVLADGTRVDCVPRELVLARMRHLLCGVAVAAVGLAIAGRAPVLAGLILGLSTHSLRTALGIPVNPRLSTPALRA